MENSKKNAKNIGYEGVGIMSKSKGQRSVSEEEIDAMYEEFISSYSFELSEEEESELNRMIEACELEHEAGLDSTISHEDIINQYKHRYVNEKNIKKYQKS